MKPIEITSQNFEAILDKPFVLLDFWASWCAPCRAFAPVFEAAAARHADITFGKVDTEAQPQLAAEFGIHAIPTLVALRDGIVVYAQPGALSVRTFEELIAELRALDMDDVRRQLDAEDARQGAMAAGGTR